MWNEALLTDSVSRGTNDAALDVELEGFMGFLPPFTELIVSQLWPLAEGAS